MTITPRIYVACLAAYNHGRLHGAWIGAAQSEWSIWDSIQTMLAASPIAGAEEWAIHDHEGFLGADVSEHADIAAVARLAEFVGDHGAKGVAILDYYGGDLDEAAEALTDRYLGCWTDLATYMQECMEQTATVPAPFCNYIDWEAMARDAELSGDVISIETAFHEVHVFAAG